MKQLKRVRWAVRGVLVLGLAASAAGNVLHAQPNGISRAIAAWPVLALLLTIELIARIPVHRRLQSAVRVLATAVIAGIAAWVSYWHMAGVAARYGETGASPYLLPLSVDGLIVVASICLVELGGRIRSVEEANEGVTYGEVSGQEAAAPGGAGREDVPRDGEGDAAGEGGTAERGDGRDLGHRRGPRAGEVGPVLTTPAPAEIEPPKPVARRPHTQNPQRIERAHRKTPDATHQEIADRLNLSPATVKKYRPPKERPEKVNGKVPELEGVGS